MAKKKITESNIYTEKIEELDVVDIMKKSYIDYSVNIIVARALPDVRDGLKPVQRRILFSMLDLNLLNSNPYVKAARTVGDTLGKYHPHGDSSIYNAMARMSQNFAYRYPLVDGHGNFGSIDGDDPAAMRYTEARMALMGEELVRDIHKNTVDFAPNFDSALYEPVVMPTRFPNLLVNGATGIAVGMATNMPPHNLNEIIDAIIAVIDKPSISGESLLDIVTGPDFPTGGYIVNKEGIKEAYLTGRGKIYLRGKVDVENVEKGRQQLVISEIPYEKTTTLIVNEIINIVKNNKDSVLNDISEIRDESDKSGIRIVLELKKETNPTIILNALYKQTSLQITYGIINLAIVNGEPKELTLKELIEKYIEFQKDVLFRRTKFDLEKAQNKLHLLEGYIKIGNQVDKAIKLIRTSKNKKEAEEKLQTTFKLSELQASAITDLRLHKLTTLSIEETISDFKETEKIVTKYTELLNKPKKLELLLKKELLGIKNMYGDGRRTQILDIVPEENVVIKKEFIETDLYLSITSNGLIYVSNIDNPQFNIEQQDYVIKNISCKNTDQLIVFDKNNNYYKIKISDIPITSKNGKGSSIYNIITSIDQDTKILYYNVLNEKDNILFISTNGMIKRVELSEFVTARQTGFATKLKANDSLLSIIDFTDNLMLVTALGKVLRFDTDDVRPMGRNAIGIVGIKLEDDDYLIASDTTIDREFLFVICNDGTGKKIEINNFKSQGRATKGVTVARLRKTDSPITIGNTTTNESIIVLYTNTNKQILIELSQLESLKRTDTLNKIIELANKEYITNIINIKKE